MLWAPGVLSWIRALLVAALVAAATLLGPDGRTVEQAVTAIPLGAGLERPEAEISGLAWYGDELVLLPQYPARLDGNVFAMRRGHIEAWLDGRRREMPAPRAVPLTAPGLDALEGFEGYEAIAFHGDEVFVTVEVETDRPWGLLLGGRVVGALERIELEVERRVVLTPQADIENLAYEALVVSGDRVLVFYETNGKNNPAPRALAFDTQLRPAGEVALGTLEYRITDVTEVEADGRFWAVNYYWPGAEWQPGDCPLASRFGLGATHARSRAVERLVELRVTEHGVEPAGTAPVQLELDVEPRNWEGVVRLGERGFLVVTDEHPTSILGFVSAGR